MGLKSPSGCIRSDDCDGRTSQGMMPEAPAELPVLYANSGAGGGVGGGGLADLTAENGAFGEGGVKWWGQIGLFLSGRLRVQDSFFKRCQA